MSGQPEGFASRAWLIRRNLPGPFKVVAGTRQRLDAVFVAGNHSGQDPASSGSWHGIAEVDCVPCQPAAGGPDRKRVSGRHVRVGRAQACPTKAEGKSHHLSVFRTSFKRGQVTWGLPCVGKFARKRSCY
jgi:hypothetical protein